MAHEPKNQIKRLRSQKGLSQAQLAEAVGAHWITISKLERGKIRLTQDWMTRIGSALGVPAANLIEIEPGSGLNPPSAKLVKTDMGIVLQHLDEAPEDFTPISFDMRFGEQERHIWVYMLTDAFHPTIHAGDMIRFTYHNEWVNSDAMIDRLCLVHTKGDAPALVGILKKTMQEGVFDIETPGSRPVRNIQATDIARATIITSLGTAL